VGARVAEYAARRPASRQLVAWCPDSRPLLSVSNLSALHRISRALRFGFRLQRRVAELPLLASARPREGAFAQMGTTRMAMSCHVMDNAVDHWNVQGRVAEQGPHWSCMTRGKASISRRSRRRTWFNT
jgi:hypothetical protein